MKGERCFGKNCQRPKRAQSFGGKPYLYGTQKVTWVRLVKNLTLRRPSESLRSFPCEEKSTPPYLLFIYYKLETS
jgi:hypothetical protein